MIHILKYLFDKLPIPKGRSEIFNLPNCITLLRIGVIPILFVLLFEPDRLLSLGIAFFFILAAVTDLLDGYIARKYCIVTRMGKFLDPLADKLIVSTAMILMIPIGRIPAWVVAIMIMRDLFVDGLRNITSCNGVIIQASPLGKKKTLSQVIAISALLIHYPFLGINAHLVGIVVLYVALFFSLWSGMDYFVKYHREVLQR